MLLYIYIYIIQENTDQKKLRIWTLQLVKAGSRHSQDNIFHINTSSYDEKRPTLLFFLNAITKHDIVCLNCLL